jgi:membrane-bound metal-dependent hydrolase YbcI (DUF457 family)
MCEGRTHAISGAVTGAAVAEYILHLPLAGTVALAGLTAGAAVLPDLDHPQATLAHSFGFMTKLFAEFVGKISGGHRHGTHSVAGIAIFTGLAWAAVHYRHDLAGRIGLCVLLSLIIAGGLYAARVKGHFADLIAIGGAVAMTVTGTGLALVAIATGLGCAAHIIGGDMFTDSGCPLGWPLARYRFKWVPEPLAFTTGTRPEGVFALVLMIALIWLAGRAVAVPHWPAL